MPAPAPKDDNAAMDMLAEEVSRHGSLSRAARKIGVSSFRAQALWARILARIGPQAA